MRLRLIAVASFVVVLGGCGSDGRAPVGDVVSAVEGGSVQSVSHDIDIPGMALGEDTEVTLSRADASGYPALPGARPDVLRLEPEGTELARPAQVTIHADFIDAGPGDGVSVAQLVTGDGAAFWSPIESEPMSGGSLAVAVTRFAPLAVVVTERPTGSGAIEGTLVWGDGSPVTDAPVVLHGDDTPPLATVTTDGAGLFRFTDLEPGRYSLVVDYECSLERVVDVAAGTPTRADLVLCAGP
jgi:hypothetical protein